MGQRWKESPAVCGKRTVNTIPASRSVFASLNHQQSTANNAGCTSKRGNKLTLTILAHGKIDKGRRDSRTIRISVDSKPLDALINSASKNQISG